MKRLIYLFLLLMPVSYLQAAEIAVTMHALGHDGPTNAIGVIVVKETAQGLQFQPHLRNLEPGKYMFTVNENVGCGSKYTESGANVPGMAAGRSMNELPAITVNANGVAEQTITMSGLTIHDVRGRTLVISSDPKPGFTIAEGNESRVACGSLELYR